MNLNSKSNNQQYKSSIYLAMLVINACLGAFNIGYAQMSMTLAIDTLFKVHGVQSDKDFYQGLYNSIGEFGSLAGVFSVKFLLQHFSPKHILKIADVLGIMSIFMIIPIKELFISFRFVLGISNGINLCVLPFYVREISPLKLYQNLSLIIGIQIGFGMLFGSLTGLGFVNLSLRSVDSHYFQFVFAIPALVSLCRLIDLITLFPIDTPASQFLRNRPEAARRIIDKLYKPDFQQQIFDEQIRIYEKTSKTQSRFHHIFRKQHRRRLLCACLVAILYIGSGAAAIQYYSGQLFSTLSDDILQISLLTVGVTLMKVSSGFCSIPLVIKFSRRAILGYSSLLLIILFGILAALQYHDPNSNLVVLVILVYTVLFIQGGTWSQISWTVIGELVNQDGVYVAVLVLQTFLALIVYFFPVIVSSIKIAGVFVLFGIFNLLGLIFVVTLLRETKGLNPDQVQQQYHKALRFHFSKHKHQIAEHTQET